MEDIAATIFQGDLDEQSIEDWIEQFEDFEQVVVRELLGAFRWYGANKTISLVASLRELLVEKINFDTCCFVPAGAVAKSGNAIAYFFRRASGIAEDQFVAEHMLPDVSLEKVTHVVFIDDFIGSGQDAVSSYLRSREVFDKHPGIKVIFASLVALDLGVRRVVEETPMTVVCPEVIPESDLPFTPGSTVFKGELARRQAAELFEKYGRLLAPQKPMGYARSQALVGFFFGTPNNTLPIFWASTQGWKPLLPYGESARDPTSLLEPPMGVPASSVARTPFRATIELQELAKYDRDSNETTLLVSVFQKMSNLIAFVNVLDRLDIQPPVSLGIVPFLQELVELKHEGKPVHSAAVIVPQGTSLDSLGTTVLDLTAAKSTLSDLVRIKSWVQFASAEDGALVIDSLGNVLGLVEHRQEIDVEAIDPFLPARFDAKAQFFRNSKGLGIIFDGPGRVHLFDGGRRLLSLKAPNWHLHLGGDTESISKLTGLSEAVLESVLKLAISISDFGSGGLLCVGDAEAVFEFAAFRRESPGWTRQQAREIGSSALLARVAQDGATVLDEGGYVLESQVTLDAPRLENPDIPAGSGTRHEAGARIAAATHTLAIVISSDGPINLMFEGKRVLRMEG